MAVDGCGLAVDRWLWMEEGKGGERERGKGRRVWVREREEDQS